MDKVIDLTGKRFGRLTVIERSEKTTKSCSVYWKCICDCGNETIVSRDNIRRRKTKSCGCLRKELLDGKNRKMVEKRLNNYKARKDNSSTRIKNICYQPNQGSACYAVKIVRKNNKYRQSFSTLQDAVRAKEYVLSRYKKGIPNWNDKL